MDSLALSGTVTEYLGHFCQTKFLHFCCPGTGQIFAARKTADGKLDKREESRRKSDKEYVFAGRRNFRLARHRGKSPAVLSQTNFSHRWQEKRQEAELTAGLTVCNLSLDSLTWQMGIGRLNVLVDEIQRSCDAPGNFSTCFKYQKNLELKDVNVFFDIFENVI